MYGCQQATSDGAGGAVLSAVHWFNNSHHQYTFTLHLVNLSTSDLHRYDLQVANDLGTTLGSVHVLLGQYMIVYISHSVTISSTASRLHCAPKNSTVFELIILRQLMGERSFQVLSRKSI